MAPPGHAHSQGRAAENRIQSNEHVLARRRRSASEWEARSWLHARRAEAGRDFRCDRQGAYRRHPKALEGQTLVGFSDFAIVLREVVEGYLQEKGIALTPSHRVETFSTALSLVASLRGVALMPAYVEALLPWSVVSRPLMGEPLTIDLAIGYRPDNPSPVLKTFLAGLDQLIVEGPAGTMQVR